MKWNKGHYILLFIFVLLAGLLFKITEDSTFTIVKNQTAYAPEIDVVSAEFEDESDNGESDVININKADKEELSKLPDIGPAMAERIIKYRTKYGDFEVIEDIMKVSGIGDKTFQNIKSQICVK